MNRIHVLTSPDAAKPMHFGDRVQAKRTAAVLARKSGIELHARPHWLAVSARATVLLDQNGHRTGYRVETFPIY